MNFFVRPSDGVGVDAAIWAVVAAGMDETYQCLVQVLIIFLTPRCYFAI